MKRIGARVMADLIFAAHTALILFLLTGWLLPTPYYYVYVAAVALTLVTQLIWRYCILTTWEFYFRKIIDPTIDHTPYYLTYYGYQMFPALVNETLIDRLSLVFLSVSLAFAGLRLTGIL